MTIIDVAKHAGVSKTTVSRVINRDAGVAAETVARVNQAIQELDYCIPEHRRGPKKKNSGFPKRKTGNIVIILCDYNIADLVRLHALDTINSIEFIATENNYSILLYSLESLKRNKFKNLLKRNYDGLIVLASAGGYFPREIKKIMADVPTIQVAPFQKRSGDNDIIFYNNYAVGKMAAEYFHDRGYKHVAYLSPYYGHIIHDERQKAFMETADALGMQVDDYGITYHVANIRVQHTAELVEKMLESSELPQGLFITYVTRAIHAYHILRQNGIEPMRDIDIITTENNCFHIEQMDPQPAVIDVHMDDIGRQSVQRLLYRINNPQEKTRNSILLEPDLIIPASRK